MGDGNLVDTTNRLLAVQTRVEGGLARAYEAEKVKITEVGAERQRVLAELGDNMRVRTVVKDGAGQVTRTGELSAIFAEMDLRDIDSIQIGNIPSEKGTVPLVRLNLGPINKGELYETNVRLTVAGSDRSWVGGVIEEVSAELARSQPWWSFLRSPGAALFLSYLLALGLTGAIVWVRDPKFTVGGAIGIGIVIAFGAGVFGLIFVGGLLRLMLPGFEVYEPGPQPAGRRTPGVIVATASFLIGVAGLVLGILAL